MSLLPEKRYEFGVFAIDAPKLELFRAPDGISEQRLSLRLQVFRALVYLIENRHRVVDAEELWGFSRGGRERGDSSYSDEIGRRLIHDCRAVLGDAGRHCIRSVAPRLYRFECPVRESNLSPSPTFPANLAHARAQRGPNDEMLVSGIQNVAQLMQSEFIESPLMDDLGRVYKAQHCDQHSHYTKCSVIATARGLLAAHKRRRNINYSYMIGYLS
jgi:DNA-binding winged helix-turn-helix (wHTH) protein